MFKVMAYSEKRLLVTNGNAGCTYKSLFLLEKNATQVRKIPFVFCATVKQKNKACTCTKNVNDLYINRMNIYI